MKIPKNKDKTFYADINIFFSTYLPVYIHKVFNFALYQQGVNSKLPFDGAFIDNEASRIGYFFFISVHNRLIKQKHGLITYPARKIVFIC